MCLLTAAGVEVFVPNRWSKGITQLERELDRQGQGPKGSKDPKGQGLAIMGGGLGRVGGWWATLWNLSPLSSPFLPSFSLLSPSSSPTACCNQRGGEVLKALEAGRVGEWWEVG